MDVIEAIGRRMSIRNYSDEPIDRKNVIALLEQAERQTRTGSLRFDTACMEIYRPFWTSIYIY